MTENIKSLAEQFTDALHQLENGGKDDAESVAALFADDARLTNSALQLTGEERVGRDEILRFWREYKEELGDARSKFHRVVTNDPAAGLFWTTTGHGPDGQTVEYDGATLLEFGEDGKIQRFHGYYDTRALQVRPSSTEK